MNHPVLKSSGLSSIPVPAILPPASRIRKLLCLKLRRPRPREEAVAAPHDAGDVAVERLLQRVADDLGIRLVQIYTGSLSAADGPAASYLDYMRYNTEAIVNALQ